MLACPDALHAWLDQVSYTHLRSLAYGLRVDLPALQDSPTSTHVYECQLRIITQGNQHIDPERWHFLLPCPYPPFDNSSLPATAASSYQSSAPNDPSTSSSVDSSSPIDLSSTSSSCLAQGDTAEELQVDQLVEMEGDMTRDWKEEEYEYPEDEILWQMMALADAPDEDDETCYGEDGEPDVRIPVLQDGDVVGPATIPVSFAARSFDHLITKIPSSRSASSSARSHGKRMRSTCYNFAAVTQAHKEMAKKHGFRPPRVTRFESSPQIRFFDTVTAKTTSDEIQSLDSTEVCIIPDHIPAQATMEVDATNKDIQHEQGILHEVCIQEPLNIPYHGFNLSSTSTKSAKKTGKIARSSLKLERTLKPTVALVAVEDDTSTIPQNETKIVKSATYKSASNVTDEVLDSVTSSAKPATAMAEIPTNTNNSSEELQDLSDLTPTWQEGERCVDKGALPNLELTPHSAATSMTKPEQEDAVEVPEEHSSATFADSYTPVVPDVEGLRYSAHQHKATVHQAEKGSPSSIPIIKVALPSRQYTGFNIAKATDQRNKPAKAPRVSLKPNKRQPTIKSLEATFTNVRSPLQPRDLNKSTSEVAQSPSVKIIQTQERNGAMKQTKTVVSLKRKRDVELPSSDDEDCQSSMPVSKKPKKDQGILRDLRTVTKVDTSTSDSADDETQNRMSATQESALISRRSLNLGSKQTSAIKTSSASKFKRSDKPTRVSLAKKKHIDSRARKPSGEFEVESKQSEKLLIEVPWTSEESQLSITVAPITRVPDGARTGNYLPHLSSIVPDDQQSTSEGGDSQVPVSKFMERLDTWLAIPQEEIVWPTLASAWEASGATIAECPSAQEVVFTQQQEPGTESLKMAEFGMEAPMENHSKNVPTESRETVLTAAVPDEHTLEEENSSDTFSGSDHEMDVDEDDFNQTTPTSTEVDLMEVDEEVAPIANPKRYPKLEAEWRNGIPQYVRADFMQQRKSRWESAPALAELRNQVTTANAIKFAYDYNGSFERIQKVTVPF